MPSRKPCLRWTRASALWRSNGSGVSSCRLQREIETDAGGSAMLLVDLPALIFERTLEMLSRKLSTKDK